MPRYEPLSLDEEGAHPPRPASPSRLRRETSQLATWRHQRVQKSIVLCLLSVVAVVVLWHWTDSDSTDYAQPVRWGLIDDSFRTVHLWPIRFSVLQGAVRAQSQTYRDKRYSEHFIQILAFNEQPLQQDISKQWQTFVSRMDRIRTCRCEISIPNLGWGATITADVRIPPPGWALLLDCHIPNTWIAPLGLDGRGGKTVARKLNVALIVDTVEGQPSLRFELPMKPYHPPAPAPYEVNLCLAPLYRVPDDLGNVLEWREHHRLLGFNAVHWYSRDDKIRPFVSAYAAETGVRDTFRRAPVISPEIFNTTRLEANARYADQVLWMTDCLVRSLYRSPAPYITFIDLDEYFLPDPMPAEPSQWKDALGALLSSQTSDVASLQIMRTHPVGPVVNLSLDRAAPLAVQALNHYRPPEHGDDYDNGKAIHRVDAVELASVHRPEHFYAPTFHSAQLFDSPVKLLHMRHEFGDGPFPQVYAFTPALRRFAGHLAESLDRLEKVLPGAKKPR